MRKPKEVAYIAGPYRAATPHQVRKNIAVAADVALAYWRKGYAVICPHMNTAHFDGEEPDLVWLEGDLELLARCDVVVMGPGWRRSGGAIAEHNLAKTLGKRILYEDKEPGIL